MRTALIGLAVCLACGADSDAVKKDMAALDGGWTMVSGERDGGALDQERVKSAKRVSKDGETSVSFGDQLLMKAKFTVDPSKDPKTIDYDMTEGTNKGKKQLGIYELDGDTFKACFGAPEADRPTDFTSKPGEQRTLTVWKRQKKETSQAEEKK